MQQSEFPVAQLKAELFKALGHPIRVQVLEQLSVGERSVAALVEALDTEVSNLSQHLAVLRKAGVVVTRREGNTIYYSLRDRDMAEILAVARRMIIADLRNAQALLDGLSADAVSDRR